MFCRNNLSQTDFKELKDGFLYAESYVHRNVSGVFGIRQFAKDFKKLFSCDSRNLRITGDENRLFVYARIKNRSTPFNTSIRSEYVAISLSCQGKLYYESPKARKSRLTKGHEMTVRSDTYSPPSPVPMHIQRNAAHPFQGGGVNPR